MAVRDLRWADFDGWMDLYLTRFDEIRRNPDLGVYLRQSRPTRSEEVAIFSEVYRKVRAGDAVVAVAEREGRIVGVCSVHRRGDHLEDRHVGELAIAVHPERRGQGIGSELLEFALRGCQGKFEILQLSVLDNNLRAIELYQRFGFQTCGRWPRSFKRGERYSDEVLMWRPVALPSESGVTPSRPD